MDFYFQPIKAFQRHRRPSKELRLWRKKWDFSQIHRFFQEKMDILVPIVYFNSMHNFASYILALVVLK